MVLRQRKGKSLNKVVQELDAFPKVPETYVEQTVSGATISLITLALVGCLVWSEGKYFFNPGFKFKFVTDSDYEAKLSINIDMTVAMPCNSIGADILDSTNQNTFSFGQLKEESTWYELDQLQRKHFEEVKNFNSFLREEYHAIQEVMWQSGRSSFYSEIPKRQIIPDEPHDACRIYGSLSLNKVSGNFHISAGKSIPLMRGHAHLTGFMGTQDYNFSHRIDRFSFGSGHVGMVHPLEGDEKIATKNLMNYQYFVQVVPTDVQTSSGLTYSTYQYSVKDQERPIEHGSGSHGTPGIYFKYDMSALKIRVQKDRENLAQFLIRLCAGVGGLVATSHMVCGLIKGMIDFYCCSLNNRKSSTSKVKATANLISPQERTSSNNQRKQEDKMKETADFVHSDDARNITKEDGILTGNQVMTLEQVEQFIKK